MLGGGSGERTVILLHGLGVNAQAWRPLAEVIGEPAHDRVHELAGSARLRPEVDDHGNLQVGLDDFGFKVFQGNVKGKFGVHRENPWW